MGELCGRMYENSARCHQNYKSFRKGLLSAEQWNVMQLSCSYIDSIESGNYDEFGYSNNWNYENQPEWVRDNKLAQSAGKAVSRVSPLQVFFLLFSILACSILAVWSKTLHTSLVKGSRAQAPQGKESWAPGRPWTVGNLFHKKNAPDKKNAPGLAASDSGIGASRVRSDASYYLS